MVKIVFIFCLKTSLWSLSLSEYIHLSLRDSTDSINYQDTLSYSKYDLQTANNQFDISIKPNSSIGLNQDSGSITIGLSASQANLYGGEIYTSISSTKIDSELSKDDYNSQTTIGYRQALLKRWGEKYNNYNIYTATQRFNLAKEKEKYINNQIILKATEKYFNVILNYNRINIYEESYKRSKRDFEIAQAKYSSGMVSAVDMHRANLNMLNAQKNLQDSKKNYLDLVDELLYFINQDFDNNIKDNIQMDIKKFNFDFNIKYDYSILKNNIQYKEKLIEKEILQDKIFRTKRDFLPDIILDMNYRINGEDNNFNESFDSQIEQWSMQLSSEYNFNTDDKKIAFNKVMIEQSKLKRELNELERNIIKDIKNTQNRYNNLNFNLEISSLKVEAAKMSLEAANIKYQQGVGTNFDLLDASTALENAKLDYISNLLSYNLTILKLADTQNLLDYDFAIGIINE